MICIKRVKIVFDSILVKPLIFTLLVSLGLNGLFGYLSYSFHSDKAVAESQLDTAVDANKGLQESLDKKDTACIATDNIVVEYEVGKQEIGKEKDAVLNAIDKLVPTPALVENKQKRQENANKQNEDVAVPLDSMLPDNLISLLSESCLRAKGRDCDNP